MSIIYICLGAVYRCPCAVLVLSALNLWRENFFFHVKAVKMNTCSCNSIIRNREYFCQGPLSPQFSA